MGELRVNLRHLLEDIRDASPFFVGAVILIEPAATMRSAAAGDAGWAFHERHAPAAGKEYPGVSALDRAGK